MAKKIIFSNQKGGVAKTTSTLNISAQLAVQGNKVLMIDLDPQASLTIISGYGEPEQFYRRNLTALIEQSISRRVSKDEINIHDCIYPCVASENLFIMPSDIELATFDFDLTGTIKGELTLSMILSEIENEFDYICIDCPPSFGILSLNGFMASDVIIACCEPAYQSLMGLKNMLTSLSSVQKRAGKEFNFGGTIVTRVGRTKNAKEAIEIIEQNYNKLGEIKELADTVKGEVAGYPISIFKPSHCNSREFYDITQKIMGM